MDQVVVTTMDQVVVKWGHEKATVYVQGGIGFSEYVHGVGWIVCDEPSALIFRVALAARKAAFPQLESIGA